MIIYMLQPPFLCVNSCMCDVVVLIVYFQYANENKLEYEKTHLHCSECNATLSYIFIYEAVFVFKPLPRPAHKIALAIDLLIRFYSFFDHYDLVINSGYLYGLAQQASADAFTSVCVN